MVNPELVLAPVEHAKETTWLGLRLALKLNLVNVAENPFSCHRLVADGPLRSTLKIV